MFYTVKIHNTCTPLKGIYCNLPEVRLQFAFLKLECSVVAMPPQLLECLDHLAHRTLLLDFQLLLYMRKKNAVVRSTSAESKEMVTDSLSDVSTARLVY